MTAPPQLVKSAASLIYTMPERKVRCSVPGQIRLQHHPATLVLKRSLVFVLALPFQSCKKVTRWLSLCSGARAAVRGIAPGGRGQAGP